MLAWSTLISSWSVNTEENQVKSFSMTVEAAALIRTLQACRFKDIILNKTMWFIQEIVCPWFYDSCLRVVSNYQSCVLCVSLIHSLLRIYSSSTLSHRWIFWQPNLCNSDLKIPNLKQIIIKFTNSNCFNSFTRNPSRIPPSSKNEWN